MGGSTPTQPTQTTSTALSPQAQQVFDLALPGLYQYASSVPQRYQGSTIAGLTPDQVQGEAGLLDSARSATSGVNQTLTGGLQGLQNFGGGLNWNPATTPYTPGAAPNYTPFVGQNLQTSSDIFNDPGIWNPAFNTGTRAAIDAATRPIYQNFNEQVLPGIKDQAIMTGGFGGSTQGIASGLAAGRTSQAAGDVGAKIVEDLYGQNLNAVNSRYATNLGAENQRYGTNVGADQARYATNLGDALSRYGTDVGADQARYATNTGIEQNRYNTNTQALLQSLGMIPGFTSAQVSNALLPGQIQTGIGEQQQGLNQAQINANIQGFNYDQLAPFLQSRDIMSLAMGFPGQTTTSTGNVPQANPWLQSAGGALTGAAAGSTFGPIGTGVGAVGGGLLPWLSRL